MKVKENIAQTEVVQAELKQKEVESVPEKSIANPIVKPIVRIHAEKDKLSGFEAFKRQKELEAQKKIVEKDDDEVDAETGSSFQASGAGTDIKERVEANSQSETNELNSDGVKSIKVVFQSIDEAYMGFYQTQGPRISTCLKSLSYRLNESQLIIELSTSGQESIIEEVKPQMMQFFKAHLKQNPVKNIGWEMGEMQLVERRPYTDKEKLEFLIKKHPALGEALESLHLRLP